MQRTGMLHMGAIRRTGAEDADTSASSDNSDQVGEDVELALLAATMRRHGAPSDGVKATVARLAILRSAYRAGEITESVMDERADVMLRRLFARKPRALVAAGARS